MRTLLVVNPVSGGKDHKAVLRDLRSLLRLHKAEFEFLLTNGKNDELRIQRALDKFRPETVVAGGGDGTVQTVARNLIARELPLGILPMGSANGLARALGLPADPVECLQRVLTSANVVSMDMLKFNDEHLCIHVGDIGVNALIVKKYGESGERGMMSYARFLLASIQESPLLKVIIRTPDGITTKQGYMMAFANAHKYGTGVHISEGSVTDGKFEICNVAKISLDNAIKAGLTILNVFIDKNMFSDVISCTEAEVEIDTKTHFQIDGEYMGLVDHLRVEVIPGCIKVRL